MFCHCILQLYVFVCSCMSLFSQHKQQLWGQMWHPAADKVPANKQSNEQTCKPYHHSHSGLSRKKDASKSAHMVLGWRAKEKLRKDKHSNITGNIVMGCFLEQKWTCCCSIFFYVPLCTQWLKPPLLGSPLYRWKSWGMMGCTGSRALGFLGRPSVLNFLMLSTIFLMSATQFHLESVLWGQEGCFVNLRDTHMEQLAEQGNPALPYELTL